MLKLLLALLLLSTSDVLAEDEVAEIPAEQIFAATEETAPAVLPSCQDEKVIMQAKELLESYNREHPVNSLYEKRQRALQLKNISAYKEEAVAGYTSKKNEIVANKLLMTKINQGLTDDEIRLCRSVNQNARFHSIYLMMYANNDNQVELYILNFLDNPNEELKTVIQ